MGIFITNQTNNNECACCVITSLYNYFYKSKIDKESILQEANLQKSGLSIFDFEVLAEKFNIGCESYNVEWNEFKEFKYNGYFVCLTKHDDLFHYVIISKKNKIITIYDSLDGKKNLDYETFHKIFCDVIIFVKRKETNQIKRTITNDLYHFMNVRNVIISFLVSFVSLILSVLTAGFINYVISIAINNNSVSNLITVIFFFGMLFLFQNILGYIESLFSKTNYKNLFKILINNLTKKLLIKDQSFSQKINLNWMYRTDECIDTIANFLTVSINQTLSNSFLFIITSIMICIINYWFIFLIAMIFLYKMIFFVIKFRKQKDILKSLINIDNKNNNDISRIIDHLNYESNANQRGLMVEKIKQNYSNLFLTVNETMFFSTNLEFFETLIEDFIYVAIIGISGYFIISDNILDVGELIFLLGLFQLNKNSLSEITMFFIAKEKYKFYYQVYLDLINIGNIKNIDKNFNMKITSIKLKSNITNKIYILKNNTTLSKNNINQFYSSKEHQITFNNINDDFSSSNVLQNKLIVIDSNAKFTIDEIAKTLQSDNGFLIKTISFFQTNLSQRPQNYYEQLLINIVSIINSKNKIIIFYDIVNALNKEHKIYFKKEIVPYLIKNNFILWG